MPGEHSIRGFHGATLSLEGYERTARLLTEHMGYTLHRREENRFRYHTTNSDGLATTLDLLCTPDAAHGRTGTGVVHHIAFRTPDDAEEGKWLRTAMSLGFNCSPVMDRNYFRSIYFREPSGVLFEIATDQPGFAIDEPEAQLGRSLMLPEKYESIRAVIEKALPPITIPANN